MNSKAKKLHKKTDQGGALCGQFSSTRTRTPWDREVTCKRCLQYIAPPRLIAARLVPEFVDWEGDQ